MSDNNKTGQGKNRPVHTVRIGNIKAAVWVNDTASGTMFNVTVSRSYKDGEDWKESGSFGFDDVLTLMKCLDMAHTWIYTNREKPAEQKAA